MTNWYKWAKCLLEDLSVSPWVLLAVDDKWLLPGPLLVDELAVLSLGGIELGELVGLVVWSDIEASLGVLAADDESSLDDGVVGSSVDGSASEDVLAGSLKTGEEAADQVGGHEGLGELIVVLVVNGPDGVVLWVVVLPEPLEGNWSLLVGVLALPLIKWDSWLWKSLAWVLGLWCLDNWLLLLLNGLWLWGSLWGWGLLGLNLLWSNVLEDWLINEVELASNSGVDWLVVDGLVPAGGVWVGLAPLLVEEELEATGDDTGSEEIGKGDALSSEVGVVTKVSLDDGDGLEGLGLVLLDGLLVVWLAALEWTEPSSKWREDLGVEVRHPLQDGGVVLLGLSEEGGLLVLGGDCK